MANSIFLGTLLRSENSKLFDHLSGGLIPKEDMIKRYLQIPLLKMCNAVSRAFEHAKAEE